MLDLNMLSQLKKDLAKLANPFQAEVCRRFFKTSKGEYAYGDLFLGIKVLLLRQVAKKYLNLSFIKLQLLLNSKIHEYRLIALLILVLNYRRQNTQEGKKQLVNFYLKNTNNINNWDLVDLSCSYILGDWCLHNNPQILYNLARSSNFWERRIAIVSTWSFIRQNYYSVTLEISRILFKDNHVLLHKAVGWMLREVGKRNKKILIDFLKQNYSKMPRLMLRYAIEKLSDSEKNYYLKKSL
jgi:3-methyladenine DNA glycosylase AlkD